MGSSPLPPAANSTLPVEPGGAVKRADWKHIPSGATIEVVSIRGNKRSGTFRGFSDKGLFLMAEAGKSQLSHLLPEQLESVRVFIPANDIRATEAPLHATHAFEAPAGTSPISEAIPGSVISIDDLQYLPDRSRVELTSVRGNPRSGIYCGLKPNGDISFIPDADGQPAVYPRSQLFSVRVLANGPQQTALQSEMLAQLRQEFQKAAVGFAAQVGEMRGIIIVDAKSGRIIEIKKSGATERDTLSWDECGILRPEFAEFTITVNLNKGSFEARSSAMTHPDALATATLRQCLADYVSELMRNRRAS